MTRQFLNREAGLKPNELTAARPATTPPLSCPTGSGGGSHWRDVWDPEELADVLRKRAVRVAPVAPQFASELWAAASAIDDLDDDYHRLVGPLARNIADRFPRDPDDVETERWCERFYRKCPASGCTCGEPED